MKTCQALIILHGWAGSKEKWRAVKEDIEQISRGPTSAKMAEVGPLLIKVIVPDLPGFKKETELDKPWNLDDYVGWLENFLKSNEISCFEPAEGTCPELAEGTCPERSEGFFLLGHSFGGRLAIKFAAKHPERLKGLILVGAAGIKHTSMLKHRLITAIALLSRRFSFMPGYESFRKSFYRYILRKTDYIQAEKIPYLKETFKKVIAEDLTLYLSQIKTPTLIIWGEKDKMTPLKDAYLIKEKIPNSKLEIMPKIGHAPHLESPEKLSEIVMRFLRP